jgi:hypothetical protein
MSTAEPDAGIYVVVSIADNGVVHAWGEGPVHDPSGKLVAPIASRSRARNVATKMRREEKARQQEPGEKGSVEFRVCKVLGIEPVPVTD